MEKDKRLKVASIIMDAFCVVFLSLYEKRNDMKEWFTSHFYNPLDSFEKA
jgi:hypothetical protein